MRENIKLFFKMLFNNHDIYDGSTCKISKIFIDVHDYPLNKGGNGFAKHFYSYKCPKCGKFFTI